MRHLKTEYYKTGEYLRLWEVMSII